MSSYIAERDERVKCRQLILARIIDPCKVELRSNYHIALVTRPLDYYKLFCKDEDAREMARQEVIDHADEKHKLDIPNESQIQEKLLKIWKELLEENKEKYKSSNFFPESDVEEDEDVEEEEDE